MQIHDTGLNIVLVQIIIINILIASSMLLASALDRVCLVDFITSLSGSLSVLSVHNGAATTLLKVSMLL